MFRSLNEILSIQQDITNVAKLLNDPDSDKEKFILGFKLVYSSNNFEIGFAVLNSIKPIDTCQFIEKSLIEELLNPNYRPNFALKTLKIVQFILKNASQPDSFEMAIHQHMAQYVQNGNIETIDLQYILEVITLIKSRLNTPAFTEEFLRTMCVYIVKRLAEIPVTRDSNIKTLNMDCARIIEFFQTLNTHGSITHIYLITTVYNIITQEGDVSPLACLGLTIIPDSQIGYAVQHILSLSIDILNQKNSIKNSIGRLILWQRTTAFNVPLHLWIVKIMRALHDEKHYEILNEIIFDHLAASFLTLLLPAFQPKTFQVVQVMLEVQRSEEIFLQLAPRSNKLLSRIIKEKCEIAEPLMDVLAEYMSSFPNARVVCPETIQMLEAHGRSVERSISKYRNQMSYSSLNSNVRIGLENLGNTCYINSVVQALFMIKPFCYELLQLERPDRETMAVQRIFALLLFSNRSELNLKFAMQFIRPVDFLPGIQHDSTEFMASLLDKLHEAEKKFQQRENGIEASSEENVNMDITTESSPTMIDESEKIEDETEELSNETITDHTTELNESTIIHKNFGGKMSTTCICMSCKYRSISIDSFRDLSLSFPERPKNDDDWDVDTEYSVQELLDFFFKPEDLRIDNQYHCDRCKTLCDGVRCNEVLESPKNLILTLKHFRYDSRYHTRSKLLINKMFHNEVITLNVTQGCERRAVEYRLQAAVVHSGISVDSGHYYTFAREKEQTWYKFNDSYVSDSTLEELNNLNSPNTPYILFYRRISSASSTASSSTACSTDQISTGEEKLNFETLPQFLRTCIAEDNAAYEKESKKFFLQQNKVLAKSNRWNDDDPPPSSCGSNFGVQQNRFIY